MCVGVGVGVWMWRCVQTQMCVGEEQGCLVVTDHQSCVVGL